MVLPFLLAAGAQAAGSIVGGLLQGNAAEKAKDASIHAEMAAQQAREAAAAKAQQLQQPGMDAYGRGLNALTGRLGLPSQGVDTFNGAAYLAANPDVAARAQRGVQEGVIGDGPNAQWATPEAWAAEHYQNSGQAEGRAVPGAAAGQQTGQAAAAPNALTGSFGNTADPAAFKFGREEYEASPGYAYQQEQGMKGILASSSATGALQSGAALKALQDRGQQIAYQDFDNERNVARGIYEDDRDYLTNRFDRTTDDTFRYTGIGQNALTTTTNSINGLGASEAQGLQNIGNFKAGNALQQGSIWSGVAGDVAGAAAGVIKSGGGAPATDWTKKYNLGGGS